MYRILHYSISIIKLLKISPLLNFENLKRNVQKETSWRRVSIIYKWCCQNCFEELVIPSKLEDWSP